MKMSSNKIQVSVLVCKMKTKIPPPPTFNTKRIKVMDVYGYLHRDCSENLKVGIKSEM